jgi:protein phosphatase
MTLLVAGAARATTGTRASQEDAFEIWPSGAQASTQRGEGMLAVVADGMGGHAGGEVAGQLACRTFVDTFAAANGATGDRLQAGLDAGNSAIAAYVAKDASLKGMGCTLIGAWIDRTGLRWVSVGDSLLLLFRFPDVLRLNADHSLGAFLDEQARRNQITPAEAQQNRYRNALRSALTGKPIELVDLQPAPYELHPGDWLILASDGIGSLNGDEIGDIAYANKDASPDEMAESLIAAVLAKKVPDQDNTTVLALRIVGDAADDEATTRVVRAEAAPAGPLVEDDGVVTTQRIVQPHPAQELFRRYRSFTLGAGMALMFLIGWILRAFFG